MVRQVKSHMTLLNIRVTEYCMRTANTFRLLFSVTNGRKCSCCCSQLGVYTYYC